uniref:Octamer-binding transcription factor n=1 Tax=Tanacetum cinerariifolium TaxID=118510 RepID=A0A699GV14_TANCI|nr:octamer-binding transcription factor [Tanacetum cinerariifolium]
MSLSQNSISSCYFRHVTMFFSVTNYSLDLAVKFLFSQLLADTMGEPIEGLADVRDNFPDICEDDLLDERSIDEKSSWCKLREYDDESLDRMWKQDDDNGETKGVSKCGVRKWVEMQKLFFEGSPRSSVDLKDKWQNLLAASCK